MGVLFRGLLGDFPAYSRGSCMRALGEAPGDASLELLDDLLLQLIAFPGPGAQPKKSSGGRAKAPELLALLHEARNLAPWAPGWLALAPWPLPGMGGEPEKINKTNKTNKT